MTTPSKNYSGILARALSSICDEQIVKDFCAKYQFDIKACYQNATEIAAPDKLLKAISEAEAEITEKSSHDINILSLFDYGKDIDKTYLYYQGDTNLFSLPTFTINISHASNALAVRIEEVIDQIARKSTGNLAMIGGATSSFASCVHYHECGRPVIMTTEQSLDNFKSNFADLLIYGVRPSALYPSVITFDMVTRKGVHQTIADVDGHSVNVTKLGPEKAAERIIELITEE
ncbi:hypothetical protein IJG91_00970 [Candidatus Saccharibacteria bacterium]|nr:hypothetical protein [Candidatus Saccharibacteria bacterium]